jgi:hypothetical protein
MVSTAPWSFKKIVVAQKQSTTQFLYIITIGCTFYTSETDLNYFAGNGGKPLQCFRFIVHKKIVGIVMLEKAAWGLLSLS